MSTTITDYFDDISEFEELLTTAEQQASTGREQDFVADMRWRFDKYEDDMYLSEAQWEKLEGIAGGGR